MIIPEFKRLTVQSIAPLVGIFISFLKIESINYGETRISSSHQYASNLIKGLLFLGRYERSERILVEKYLPRNEDIIELGGSLGVISSIIGKVKTPSSKLVVIEPHSGLTPLIHQNLERNGIENYTVLNYLVGEPATASRFLSGLNTLSGTSSNDGDEFEGMEIEIRSLGEIVSETGLTRFSLVCDIEGAELEMVLNDKEALALCHYIIIELHDTKRRNRLYTKSEIGNLFLTLGFEHVSSRHDVYVFRNQYRK